MENKAAKELSVIQKAHDLILWYVPLLNRLPRYVGHSEAPTLWNPLLPNDCFIFLAAEGFLSKFRLN
jgi:hypothetical protein